MFIDRVSTRTRTRHIPITIPIPITNFNSPLIRAFPIHCEIFVIRFVCLIKRFAHAAKAFITPLPLGLPAANSVDKHTHTHIHTPWMSSLQWHAVDIARPAVGEERSVERGLTGLRNCCRCTTWRMRNVSLSLSRSLFAVSLLFRQDSRKIRRWRLRHLIGSSSSSSQKSQQKRPWDSL